jgi:hypothetical protein
MIREIRKYTKNVWWRLFIALALAGAASLAVAQYQGPIGPGEATFEGGTLFGRLAEWQREYTPTLLLSAPGNRVLYAFADIAPDGSFTVELPTIGDTTPLGSTICGGPGKPRITVLSEVELLTSLEGFTTPDEFHRSLGVIGMAILADGAFVDAIGAPGTRRLQWFASLEARTVDIGECNNLNTFEIGAGWTQVTLEFGASGGPHHYRPGSEDGMGWYWWAYPETP